jgi:hypothetical protein
MIGRKNTWGVVLEQHFLLKNWFFKEVADIQGKNIEKMDFFCLNFVF